MADSEFLVRIWGARGSLPAPSAPNCAYGSDTCCVEMRCGSNVLVFDAGSGAAGLGAELQCEGILKLDLFFSHCHFDHIIGLPFLRQLYNPASTIRLFAGHFEDDTTCRQMVEDFLKPPYFPVTPKVFRANIDFCNFRPPAVLQPAEGITIRTARLNHPNGAVGYRVEFAGAVVCYITDTEHVPGAASAAVLGLIQDADIVIYDAMYSDLEFAAYKGYGHSTWQEGVRLCEAAGARQLVIFHHKHERDDVGLQLLESEAQARFPGAIVARTGLELHLDPTIKENEWRKKA